MYDFYGKNDVNYLLVSKAGLTPPLRQKLSKRSTGDKVVYNPAVLGLDTIFFVFNRLVVFHLARKQI
jgi:hypothetical protein